MKELDILMSEYYQIQKRFCFLESIKLSRDIGENNCAEYSVEIVLCNLPFYEGDNKLLLSFYGAKDIKIGRIEGLLDLLITIVDVSESQLEKIRFKVKEDENEQFSFYCDSFEFKMI
jgi:hypothetical protein